MRVFIAGIMQGSRLDDQIREQNYRILLGRAIESQFPNATVVDPWTLHPESVVYDDQMAKRTFLEMTALVKSCQLVLAYLPQASMGTGVELWEAYHAGIPTIVVSPMVHNWVIKLTATHILPDLPSLLTYITNGELKQLVDAHPRTH